VVTFSSKWHFRGWFVSLVAALALACSSSGDDDDSVVSGAATGATCPENSTLTYENWALPFFSSYCLRCHSKNLAEGQRNGAPLTYNWDDIDSVRAHLADIDLMAAASANVVNTEMPLTPPDPPVSERRKLGEWLACGAP